MITLLLFLLYAVVLSIGLAWSGYRRGEGAATPSPPHSPARILVIGATGGTGRRLVEQALERGLVVTALARDPTRLRLEHPRLTVLQGDVLDPASLEAATRGQDAVLSALGHKRFFYPNRILSGGTRNILQAMEKQGVRRFICETSLGIGDSAGRMGLYYTFFVIPLILPFYFWDKTRQERIIARSAADWTIVRPGALKDGGRQGQLRHGEGVGSFIRTVSVTRADVADFMLDQLGSNAYLRAAPGVT